MDIVQLTFRPLMLDVFPFPVPSEKKTQKNREKNRKKGAWVRKGQAIEYESC